jgi:NAD(P)-dependent dehydrogenase (short-subunit alcohol dehydrogenase family)
MNKVALITGTSTGFGLLTSIEMAKAGFSVIATMRDLARGERLRKAAAEARVSERIHLRQLDITQTGSLAALVDSFVHEFGRMDVLVNNAGYPLGGFAEDILLPELRAQMETNFFGTVAMTKAVIPVMRAQKSGHIIMVSSIAGLQASPVLSSYAASKFALEGWSESLRIELHALGIRVVLVEPGAYATDIWSKGAQIGKFAASDDAPNKDRARRFAEVVQTKLTKGDPMEVARLITQLAQQANPRLRYIVGKDARMRFAFKRLLPWRSYERLVAKATRIDE